MTQDSNTALHNYSFDVKMFAPVVVTAETREAAEALLKKHVSNSSVNFGTWPDGTAITSIAQVEDEHPVCFEVDGTIEHHDVD